MSRGAAGHQPIRTCVGCRQRAPKQGLLRVVTLPRGGPSTGLRTGVTADPRQLRPGRGAYIHPRPECCKRGIPSGIARALRTEVQASDAEALRLAVEQARKRLKTAHLEGQSRR